MLFKEKIVSKYIEGRESVIFLSFQHGCDARPQVLKNEGNQHRLAEARRRRVPVSVRVSTVPLGITYAKAALSGGFCICSNTLY